MKSEASTRRLAALGSVGPESVSAQRKGSWRPRTDLQEQRRGERLQEEATSGAFSAASEEQQLHCCVARGQGQPGGADCFPSTCENRGEAGGWSCGGGLCSTA